MLAKLGVKVSEAGYLLRSRHIPDAKVFFLLFANLLQHCDATVRTDGEAESPGCSERSLVAEPFRHLGQELSGHLCLVIVVFRDNLDVLRHGRPRSKARRKDRLDGLLTYFPRVLDLQSLLDYLQRPLPVAREALGPCLLLERSPQAVAQLLRERLDPNGVEGPENGQTCSREYADQQKRCHQRPSL